MFKSSFSFILFPFLIGTVRTWKRLRCVLAVLWLFPFLIGTVRTLISFSKRYAVAWVSIPHRYGKNVSGASPGAFSWNSFPFLIGTVRTLMWKMYFIIKLTKFPFLIGTVRTIFTPFLWCTITKFPFLIGTVRTRFQVCFHVFDKLVSIPHRYGKNLMS